MAFTYVISLEKFYYFHLKLEQMPFFSRSRSLMARNRTEPHSFSYSKPSKMSLDLYCRILCTANRKWYLDTQNWVWSLQFWCNFMCLACRTLNYCAYCSFHPFQCIYILRVVPFFLFGSLSCFVLLFLLCVFYYCSIYSVVLSLFFTSIERLLFNRWPAPYTFITRAEWELRLALTKYSAHNRHRGFEQREPERFTMRWAPSKLFHRHSIEL